MARYLIRPVNGGSDRTVSDAALPFFLAQQWVVVDTIDDTSDSSPTYLSTDESDARYMHLGEVADETTPTGSELRAFLEPKIDRTGAVAGEVPTLQVDGSLAFEAGGGGGGGGTVTNVNGVTPVSGTVTLDADDIADGTTSVVMTSAERTLLTLLATSGVVMVKHNGGTDPLRPATTLHVLWDVPDANRPATNGTTAGGDYAAVDGLDYIFTH